MLGERVPAKVGTSAKMGRIWMAHLIRIPTALVGQTYNDHGTKVTATYIPDEVWQGCLPWLRNQEMLGGAMEAF